MISLAAALLIQVSAVGAQVPAYEVETLRGLVVQYDGRYAPLDTVARDVVSAVTGAQRFGDREAVLTLLAWTFEPKVWTSEPLITIGNAELRRELRLPAGQTVYSYAELVGNTHVRGLIDGLTRISDGRKLDPLESKVSAINTRLTTLQSVFHGQVLRCIPDTRDAAAAWRAVGVRGARHDGPVEAAWDALRDAYVERDAAGFEAAAAGYSKCLAGLPAKYRPAARLVSQELQYNRIRPFRTAWIAMIAGTILITAGAFMRRRWFDVIAVLPMFAGFGVLCYGLWLRWQIAGRIPASNMFESLLMLSWGVGAFAIVSLIFHRRRVILLTASAMGALALFLADVLPLDGFVRPAPPVLSDTIWMSIHVPVIMVSYAVLTLAVVVAHAQLVMLVVAPARRSTIEAIDTTHYWYVHVGSFLLLAGIITGSMWAASSWGRYWGWDPKEVWSLVAFLGYLAIMHVHVDHEHHPRWMYWPVAILTAGSLGIIAYLLGPMTVVKVAGVIACAAVVALFVFTRGVCATAVKSILAFWLIIMTYVGVNYVLGIGLHSYGFGTGAVAKYMFRIGGLDIAFVLLCALLHLARTRGAAKGPAGHMPVPA